MRVRSRWFNRVRIALVLLFQSHCWTKRPNISVIIWSDHLIGQTTTDHIRLLFSPVTSSPTGPILHSIFPPDPLILQSVGQWDAGSKQVQKADMYGTYQVNTASTATDHRCPSTCFSLWSLPPAQQHRYPKNTINPSRVSTSQNTGTHAQKYNTWNREEWRRYDDWLINWLIHFSVFFGSEGHVALDRIQGPGYDTLLLRLIPGDLLSACPHRQFHTLPCLLDSRAALPNSYHNELRTMQGGRLYHFYDGIWYDPAGTPTHDLPCERRTR